ncbi:hypothetical protein PPS11_28453 [Pseudomonas putida S11]|nr:hypothetical protein PPS11_28453 [Pseudomonas putida S11]
MSANIPTIASVELHDEQVTPFERQLGWHPAAEDESLVEADQVFVKHGYGQSAEAIDYIRQLGVERVLVCGLQTETCVLAAGFHPVRCGADAYPGHRHDDRLFARQVGQAGHRPVDASLPPGHYLGRGARRTGLTRLVHAVIMRACICAALSRRELNSQAVRVPCGSGFSREEYNAMHGTGCAGVRG